MFRKVLTFVCSMALIGCQNISCPLDNVVKMTTFLYLDGEPCTMADTLSIKAKGTEQTLLNRLYGFSSFSLPVHQDPSGEATDTLLLSWRLASTTSPLEIPRSPLGKTTRRLGNTSSLLGTDSEPTHLLDTIVMRHTCDVHFETIDCPAAVFHRILSLSSSHSMIDSIEVINPTLNYDKTQNLRLHIRPLDR